MIKTLLDGNYTFKYDTKNIKKNCAQCDEKILGDVIDNYERRGNYCSSCNAKFHGKHYE